MSKTGIKGIVFDLDGVLVDSEPLHVQAWNNVFRARQVPVPEGMGVRFIGIVDSVTAETLHRENNLGGSWRELLAEKREAYFSLLQEGLKTYPGLKAALERLNSHVPPLRFGVATSSSRKEAEAMLQFTRFRYIFHTLVTSEDVDHTKPDPECYLKACSRLGVQPEEAAAVEDSPVGVQAAKEAGLYVVAVTTNHPESRLRHADEIAADTVGAVKTLTRYI